MAERMISEQMKAGPDPGCRCGKPPVAVAAVRPFQDWCGRGESNPDFKLGKLT